MAAITLTDTELEVFGIGVLEAYQHRDYFQEDWALFQGMTAGEVVNVPVMQEGEATNLVDGVSHNGTATMLGTEIALVDPIKSFVDVLKTQVDVRPDLNLLTTVGRQVGRDVGFGRTIRIANHLAFTADANTQTKTGDFQSDNAGLGSRVVTGIKQIATEMDDRGVDSEMRFGMLKPDIFYALRGETEVISSDFTQGQNINQAIGGNMSILNYLNFTMRNMGGIFGVDFTDSAHFAKRLPTATGVEMAFDQTNVVGIFWQHDSWAARHQTGLETNVDWIHRDQVWMPIARLHMGMRVIKLDGLWLLVHSS